MENKFTLKVYSKNNLFLLRFFISAFNMYKGINYEIIKCLDNKNDVLVLDESNITKSIKTLLRPYLPNDFSLNVKVFNFIYKQDHIRLDTFPKLYASYIATYRDSSVFYLSYLDIEENSNAKNNLLEEMVFNYYLNKNDTIKNIDRYVKKNKDGYYSFYPSNINYLLELEEDDLSEILVAIKTTLNISYFVVNFASKILSFKKRITSFNEANFDISKDKDNDFDLEKNYEHINIYKCIKNLNLSRSLNLVKSDAFEIMERIFEK